MLKRFVSVYAFCFASIACGGSPGEVGEACSDNMDCESKLCVAEFADGQEVLGGMCTVQCHSGGSASSPPFAVVRSFDLSDLCEKGEVCLRYLTGEHYCFLECDGEGGCRDGWSCSCVDLFCQVRACIPPIS